MPSKKPYKSKSLLFNTLLIISSVGTALLADENFKALLGDNIGYIGAVVGVVGFFLRFVTKEPVSIKETGTAEEMGWKYHEYPDKDKSDDLYSITH